MANVHYDFSDKVALVTGAASGIGRATALQFAASGAGVILADVDEAAGEQAARTIREGGGRALFRRTDVSQEADCQSLFAAALSHFGRLDAAFNNAGILGRLGPTADCGAQAWQAVLDVNLSGVFNCLVCEFAAMRGAGGAIVNTSSVLGLVGGTGAAAYSASKHGVIGLTRSTALEYGRAGVRVNAICPGFVATPMIETGGTIGAKSVSEAVRRSALGRLGAPEEIASVAVWLCSDAAAFVTGAVVAVDGGFTAR